MLRPVRLISALLVLGLLFGGTPLQPVAPTVAAPRSQLTEPPPAELPPGPLAEEELRQQLIAQKQELCADLQLIAGIIISTGILDPVPPMISEMTGLSIDAMESRETNACQQLPGEPPDQEKTTTELLNELRTVSWLVRMHLAAMDRVLMETPTYRPINAEGAFAAYFEMHNISVQALRDGYLALAEDPTLEEGNALAAFWQESLEPHALAEDRTLWPLARWLGDEQLARTADLLEVEHRTIDEGIARYMETLRQVEGGQAPPSALVPIAREVRIRTELHFGKEEVSLVRLLQQRLTDDQFRPVVDELDQALGPWLRQRGWIWPATAG